MNGNLAYREDRREEMIAGEIAVMSPSPRWNHMAVSGNINRRPSLLWRGPPSIRFQLG